MVGPFTRLRFLAESEEALGYMPKPDGCRGGPAMPFKWALIGFGIFYLAVLSCDENIRVDQDHYAMLR
jgi:hypothetical protein